MTEFEINLLIANGFGFGAIFWLLLWYFIFRR